MSRAPQRHGRTDGEARRLHFAVGPSLYSTQFEDGRLILLVESDDVVVTARGMSYINAGVMASVPYIAASVGVLCGGFLSDTILQRTGSANLARKLPIVSGMFLASTIVAANYVPASSNGVVIAILSLAFFGQGMTNLGWTVISDIAPKNVIGLTAGIFNFATNLAGIITPIVVGVFFGMTGSFVGPLAYIAVVALVGAFSYSVILGDIHRLEIHG